MTHDEAQQMVATEGRVTDFMGEAQGTVKGWTIREDEPERDAVFVLWDNDEEWSGGRVEGWTTELVEDLWVAPAATPGP